MLDIRLIRETPDAVKARLATRGEDGAVIDRMLETDAERRRLITQVEQLKQERNAISKQIGIRKQNGESADELLSGMKDKSDRIAELDTRTSEVDARQRRELLQLPNLPYPACPVGTAEADNPEVGCFGEKPGFDFNPRNHVELAEPAGWLDFTRAADISGSGYVVFNGQGARLERALIQFMLDLHSREHGYREVSPPFLIREEAMYGTGQLPKFREDMYGFEQEGLFLAPTAEVPVTNLFREQILPEAELPQKRVAYTPCFRREAGSAGKETKGLIRMHQFDKVELVRVVHPDTSFEALEELRREAETVLEKLGLHYRTIELCTGDLGFGAAKCYDIEVWAPGSEMYLEVSSCSNFTDFQARRIQLRYKDENRKNRFCHTLNGSGTALPRLFVALIESGQQADGSVVLPEVLHSYFGAEVMTPE
ncbi:MAG: serine--tRNA ligase [Verrucomicrobiota bacterium]